MRILLALLLALLPLSARAQAIDYNIANQSFPTFRADLNNHLSAIVQNNAGTVAPATTFPYMVWADTSGSAPILRYRNAAACQSIAKPEQVMEYIQKHLDKRAAA